MTTSPPPIRPMPVTIPAPGLAPSYMPKAASGESSRNGDEGSSTRSIRSRTGSLPRAACFAWAAGPPPAAASASRRSSSATAAALAARASCRRSDTVVVVTVAPPTSVIVRLGLAQSHLPGYDQLQNLARALANRQDLGVAVE